MSDQPCRRCCDGHDSAWCPCPCHQPPAPTVLDVHRAATRDPDLWDDDARHGDDGGER